MMRILFILCCVVALVLIFSVSGLTQDFPSPAALSSRIAELTPPDKDVPDNPIVLADEIRRINEELGETRKQQDQLQKMVKNLSREKEAAGKTLQDIRALDCNGSQPNLSPLMDEIDRLAHSALADAANDEVGSPWADLSTENIRNLPPKERCEKLKALTSNPDLQSFIDKQQNEFQELATEIDRLVDALQKRRAALLTHNQVAETKEDIFQYLWVIIGVIGLLSIGTIFVIKTFPPDLQQQWVASGQVIQFVTVMILLSVIMALGLASILKENTLGTLLGGIAGYVLSQGVGRAAAQAVKEGILKGTAAAMPSTNPPPVVSAIMPNNGPSAGGTAVAITGTGFDSVSSVTFGNVPATINRQTSTVIEATTAPGCQPGTVDVVVINKDGQSVTSPGGFTFA